MLTISLREFWDVTAGHGFARIRKISSVAAVALLLTAMRAAAHHAFAAEYDENKRVTVSGTVTKFEWANPHAWMYIEETSESGESSTWSFEMGSPGGLLRRGWRKTDLRRGDHVTAEGYRAKDGRKVANAGMVTMPDGRKLFGGFQTTPRAPVK